MSFTTLISTGVLAEHLDRVAAPPSRDASTERAFAIVDCRFKLDDVPWGQRMYREGHIPGAVYAHLDLDLSGPKTGANGRHPLPDPSTLIDTFGRLGISSEDQVVAYDQDNGMFASRLWWLLRWLGHDRVAVLDGGFAKWARERAEDGGEVRRPIAVGDEHRPARIFYGTPRPNMLVDVEDVRAALTNRALRLIDARAPERYRGDHEPIDRVPGHIPGAINHFFQSNVDANGSFRDAEELRRGLRQSIGSLQPENTICYCGSGVTACHNLLALEHAGLHGAKLYAGSWSEWASDPSRPIERG
jgi:thiosulfate/3-mercaptopyruvate sulfurtransferase